MDVRRKLFLHPLRSAAALVLLSSLIFLQGSFSRAQTPEVDASSVLSLKWPNGVDLLAAHNVALPTGEYSWRASPLTASATPGEPIATGHGFVIAVSGAMIVQTNGATLTRLGTGAATAVPEGGEIVTMSATATDVDYLLIELVAEVRSDPDTDEAGNMQVVGPINVAGGGYGLVLLNLPVAVTIDLSADDVIFGSLRPAISIPHTENALPDNLNSDRKHDRWIGALFPIGDVVATTTPPVTEPASQVPVPTSVVVPTEPIVPTEPVETPEPTATLPPAEEPTPVPATEVPVPTDESVVPDIPTVPPVPTLPPMPTLPPIPTIPPVPTVSV